MITSVLVFLLVWCPPGFRRPRLCTARSAQGTGECYITRKGERRENAYGGTDVVVVVVVGDGKWC